MNYFAKRVKFSYNPKFQIICGFILQLKSEYRVFPMP